MKVWLQTSASMKPRTDADKFAVWFGLTNPIWGSFSVQAVQLRKPSVALAEASRPLLSAPR